MPTDAGIQMTDSVRHTVGENGIQILGMDPGFHRGDEKDWIPVFTGMTEKLKDDLKSKFGKGSGL